MHNRYFKDMRVGSLKFSVFGLRSLGAGNVEIRTHLSLRFTEVGQAPNESLSDKRQTAAQLVSQMYAWRCCVY